VPRELGIPRHERIAARVPGSHAAEERVALRQRLRVPPAGRRPRRPHRGDDLVEVRATQRWRALDELEAVGQEHTDQRARRVLAQRVGRHAVHPDALGLPRLKADAQVMHAVATLDLDLNASCALVEANDLALVARAARPPRAAEVERLQQVRLAGAVAPVDDRQAGAERDVRAHIGAEVPHADAANDHGPAAPTRSAGSA
jgi:hypothetical protein